MDKFTKLVGRPYHLFDYVGDPDAERVVVIMGSGADATHETVDHMNASGGKVGVVKVRLYRPFDGNRFVDQQVVNLQRRAGVDLKLGFVGYERIGVFLEGEAKIDRGFGPRAGL